MQAGPITSLLDQGMTPSDILLRLLDGLSPRILSETPVEYRCYCSDARIIGALKSMGKDELLKLAGEQDSFEITCQFCDRRYVYSSAQLKEMAQSEKDGVQRDNPVSENAHNVHGRNVMIRSIIGGLFQYPGQFMSDSSNTVYSCAIFKESRYKCKISLSQTNRRPFRYAF
jgi:hypothetical protein